MYVLYYIIPVHVSFICKCWFLINNNRYATMCENKAEWVCEIVQRHHNELCKGPCNVAESHRAHGRAVVTSMCTFLVCALVQ